MRRRSRGLLAGTLLAAALLVGVALLLHSQDEGRRRAEPDAAPEAPLEAPPVAQQLPAVPPEPTVALVDAKSAVVDDVAQSATQAVPREASFDPRLGFEVIVVDQDGHPVPDAEVEVRPHVTRTISERRLRELEQRLDVRPGLDATWLQKQAASLGPGGGLDGILADPSSRSRTDVNGACRITGADPFGYLSAHAAEVGSSGELRLLGGADPDEVTRLVLRPMARVTGQVLSADGRPVPGALVYGEADRHDPSDRLVPAPFPPLVTDLDGRFELNVDAPSVAEFAAVDAGLEDAASNVVQVHLEAGGSVAIRLGMLGSHAIVGTISDVEGRPVAQASVALTDATLDSRQHESDAEGRFEIPISMPGEYRVIAKKDGLVQEAPVVCVLDAAQPSARAAVRMLPGSMIRGSVRSSDGEPVTDAIVVGLLDVSDREAEVLGFVFDMIVFGQTDADGAFVLADTHPGMTYVLQCSAGAGASRVELRGVAPDAVGIDLILDSGLAAGCTLTLQVVDAVTSRPIPVFEAELGSWSGTDLQHVMPSQHVEDPAGRFEFEHAPIGVLQGVRVTAPGYPPTLFAPIVAEGAQMEQQLRLGAAGRLQVRVVDERGEAVAGAALRLWLAKSAQAPVHEAIVGGSTGDDGMLRLDQLAPGRYLLRAYAEEQRSDLVEFELAPLGNQVASLVVRGAELPGSLVVAVRRKAQPISGVDVQLWPASETGEPRQVVQSRVPDVTGKTAADGCFRLNGLTSGIYLLRAQMAGHEIEDRDVLVRAGGETRVPIELGD